MACRLPHAHAVHPDNSSYPCIHVHVYTPWYPIKHTQAEMSCYRSVWSSFGTPRTAAHTAPRGPFFAEDPGNVVGSRPLRPMWRWRPSGRFHLALGTRRPLLTRMRAIRNLTPDSSIAVRTDYRGTERYLGPRERITPDARMCAMPPRGRGRRKWACSFAPDYRYV